jgi:hypothetical protein
LPETSFHFYSPSWVWVKVKQTRQGFEFFVVAPPII